MGIDVEWNFCFEERKKAEQREVYTQAEYKIKYFCEVKYTLNIIFEKMWLMLYEYIELYDIRRFSLWYFIQIYFSSQSPTLEALGNQAC